MGRVRNLSENHPQSASQQDASPDILIDPPVVKLPPKPKKAWLDDLSVWIDEKLGAESYGAPRVFDIFTIFAVTLAFALLFTCLKFLQPALGMELAPTVVSFSVFVTLVGVAQMLLWHGKKPRPASLVAGPIIWFVIGTANVLIYSGVRGLPMAFGIVCSMPVGVFAGYLAGALVAGVFLLADRFRQRFMPERPLENDEADDAIWTDDEQSE